MGGCFSFRGLGDDPLGKIDTAAEVREEPFSGAAFQGKVEFSGKIVHKLTLFMGSGLFVN
jgi:hypothetical protein